MAEDFALLDSVEYERRIKPVEEIIQEIEWTNVEPDELTRFVVSTTLLNFDKKLLLYKILSASHL